jgi:hypothetical protein
MLTYRFAQIVAFVSTLAISLSTVFASAAYACGVSSGAGGFC